MRLTPTVVAEDLAELAGDWVLSGIHWGRLTAEVTTDEALRLAETPIRDLPDALTSMGLQWSDRDRVWAALPPPSQGP